LRATPDQVAQRFRATVLEAPAIGHRPALGTKDRMLGEAAVSGNPSDPAAKEPADTRPVSRCGIMAA
jgi:hypothetical protein